MTILLSMESILRKSPRIKRLAIILVNGYWSIANHIVAHIPFYRLRRFLYRSIYKMKIGKYSSIQMGLFVLSPHKITIGNHTNIGIGVLLDGRRGLFIGSNVDINFNVKIFTLAHDIQATDYKTKGDKVIIEDYACIASGAIVLPGIVIGKGAVVGAGSVVTKNVDPFTIVAGVPARQINKRNNELCYILLPNPFPFH